MSIFDLAQKSLKFQKYFFSRTVEAFKIEIYMKTYEEHGNKKIANDFGHITKIATIC